LFFENFVFGFFFVGEKGGGGGGGGELGITCATRDTPITVYYNT